jgi:predicted RNase H-like nuclease (RuvC/YqgF family)
MSTAAEPGKGVSLPTSWARLERAAEETAVAVAFWRRRAHEAEEEVSRLRRAFEELAAERDRPQDLDLEVRRLRAENTALQSRMLQARKRVAALLRQVSVLEVDQ